MRSRRDTRCSSIKAVSSYVVVATPNITSASSEATRRESTNETAMSATAVATGEAGAGGQRAGEDVGGSELVGPVDHARGQNRLRGAGGSHGRRRDDGTHERADVLALMQQDRGKEHAGALHRQAPSENLTGAM